MTSHTALEVLMTSHNTLLGNFPYHVPVTEEENSPVGRARKVWQVGRWCVEKFGLPAQELPSYVYRSFVGRKKKEKEGVWVYSRHIFMFKNPIHAVEVKLRFG